MSRSPCKNRLLVMVNGNSALGSRKGVMATRPGVSETIGRRVTFISAPANGR
jgi:hypothetical protein